MLSRIIEPFLRPFDHPGNELILRWRHWKMRWLPYRTAIYLGYDKETRELRLRGAGTGLTFYEGEHHETPQAQDGPCRL